MINGCTSVLPKVKAEKVKKNVSLEECDHGAWRMRARRKNMTQCIYKNILFNKVAVILDSENDGYSVKRNGGELYKQ
jgi:hypothetical protein